MADSVLCDEILFVLNEKGPVTVDSESQFRDAAGINPSWSKRAVKSALSSLIAAHKVSRFRPPLQHCSDEGQPITFQLVDES